MLTWQACYRRAAPRNMTRRCATTQPQLRCDRIVPDSDSIWQTPSTTKENSRRPTSNTEEALRIDPDYALPRCELVNNLLSLDRLEEAEAEARDAVRLYPKSAAFHNNLGDALHKIRKARRRQSPNTERLSDLIRTLSTPTTTWPANYLKRENMMRRSPSTVKSSRWIQITSRLTTTWVSCSMYSLGRREEASHAYREALRLKPDHIAALVNLERFLTSRGKTDEAIELYRKALQHNAKGGRGQK